MEKSFFEWIDLYNSESRMSRGFLLLPSSLLPSRPGRSLGIGGSARPESRGIARKNHKAPFISWSRRASQSSRPVPRDALLGMAGPSPDEPAPFCGGKERAPDEILFPPMLFAGNTLAFGPQAKLCSEKGNRKVKVGKIFHRAFADPKKINHRGRKAGREKDWKIGLMEGWNIGKPIAMVS